MHAACSRYDDANTLLDSTGGGDLVSVRFIRASCEVEGYEFTASSEAAPIDNLILMVESRQITLPKPKLWPVRIEELVDYTSSVTDVGNIRCSAPLG